MPQNSNIVVDEEFRDLLPPLPGEVYEELERSIRSEGCRDAIVLWNGVIVDGHNRYAICQTHKIAFQQVEKAFGSRDEAKIWIISTQFGRRQLSQEEMIYYRGMQYNLEKSAWGRCDGLNKKVSGNNDHLLLEESESTKTTAQRLADQYNVGERTIRLDAEAADAIDKIGKASPDAKKKILTGKSNITKKELVKLNKAPDEEISSTANRIADGTYTKKEKPAAEVNIEETEAREPVFPAESDDVSMDNSAYTHADESAPEQPDESENKPEPVSEPIPRVPDGWDLPEIIQGKKQTWCAFISAGIDALGSVIRNIEKDLRNKLPLIETQAERDFLRRNFQSYIDRQLEIIKQI